MARPGVTTNAFGYNGLDARVSKTDSSGTYGFKRNGAGVTDPVLSDGAATYTPGISERRGGNSKFLHSGMKNADAQSGASANVDSSRTYDAFGNLTGSSGTWSGPFGYAGGFGYQEDPDHGLRLLGHRYYDSSTGRFISKDPIGDGRNWTAYCAGNPVAGADPNGLDPFLMPEDENELLRRGWKQDTTHGDKLSRRYIAPNGRQMLEYSDKKPNATGWKGKNHGALYERNPRPDRVRWDKVTRGVPNGGHLVPGESVVDIRGDHGPSPNGMQSSDEDNRRPPRLPGLPLIGALILSLALMPGNAAASSCTGMIHAPGYCASCRSYSFYGRGAFRGSRQRMSIRS